MMGSENVESLNFLVNSIMEYSDDVLAPLPRRSEGRTPEGARHVRSCRFMRIGSAMSIFSTLTIALELDVREMLAPYITDHNAEWPVAMTAMHIDFPPVVRWAQAVIKTASDDTVAPEVKRSALCWHLIEALDIFGSQDFKSAAQKIGYAQPGIHHAR